MATQIIKTKKVFESEKIDVISADIDLENGHSVTWNKVNFSDVYLGVPITENKTVIMVNEWRLGPEKKLLNFPGVRADKTNRRDNLKELQREMMEEIGLIEGDYNEIVNFSNGPHINGFHTIFSVQNFELGKTSRDKNEIIETIELPIKNLYQNLIDNYTTTAAVLLAAKIIETL